MRLRLTASTCIFAIVLCCATASLAQQSAAAPASATPEALVPPGAATLSGPQNYVVAPDDVLDVYIIEVPELSRTYRVEPDGTLKFPFIKPPVPAAGMTLEQLSAELAKGLKDAGAVSRALVTVSVKETRFSTAAITGAVNKPTVYPVFGYVRLLDLLSEAGGLTDSAGSMVQITRGEAARRAAPGQPESLTISLSKLFTSTDQRNNVAIYPGDTVTVPMADVIYVVGAVKKSGGFALSATRESVSVLQALALAEDLKSTASKSQAMIIRRGQNNAGRQEIALDLNKILQGKSPDVVMQPNDILFVPESAGKKAFHRGAEAALQMATGIAVWRR